MKENKPHLNDIAYTTLEFLITKFYAREAHDTNKNNQFYSHFSIAVIKIP